MSKTCTCGRIGEHCPNADCGSISKTPLKQRTIFMLRQTGRDVRYHTCRKCGTEYGWYEGKLYEPSECYAPKEIRFTAAPKSVEEDVKNLNECIQVIQSRGGVVTFPHGIKDIDEKAPGIVEPRAPIQDITQEGQDDLVIERIEPRTSENCIKLEDMFKSKETPNDSD